MKEMDCDYEQLAKLVTDARGGDSEAFTGLYEATFQRQHFLAESYLKDEYMAQDAIQESYIIALKNLDKLKDPRLFVSWLNRITFHVCFAMKTKQKKHNYVYLNPESLELEHCPLPDPETLTVSKDYEAYIRKQIDALPYSESLVIKLMYYDDMTIEDIVALTGMSRSTVKRRLNSGRERLKKRLAT